MKYGEAGDMTMNSTDSTEQPMESRIGLTLQIQDRPRPMACDIQNVATPQNIAFAK